MKRSVIINIKLVCKSCLTTYETTQDLRSLEIKKYQENVKTLYNFCLLFSTPPEMKVLLLLAKSLLKNRNWTFPVVRDLTWKLEFVSLISWIIVSGSIFLLSTRPRLLQIWFVGQFSHKISLNLKLKKLICKKALKFVLPDNFFPDLFNEV